MTLNPSDNPLNMKPPELPGRIQTEAQAINWMEEMIQAVLDARENLDVEIPDDVEATIRWQTKAGAIYYVRHGACMGALTALYRSGKLSEVGYTKMRERCLQTLAPTRVGRVSGFAPPKILSLR